MAAPFDSKGRYRGGISSIVNFVLDRKDYLKDNDLEIIKYETCRIKRTGQGSSKFSLENLKNAVNVYFSLLTEVKRSNVQVVYYHSSIKYALLKDLLALRRLKRKTGVRIALHIHFAEYDKIMTGHKLIDNIMLSIMQKYIDKFVFLSYATEREFIDHGIDSKKTTVIYNFSTVEATKAEQINALKLDNKKCKFLFVGSYDKRKGICDLLECFSKMPQDTYEFHMCGGYADESVKSEIKGSIEMLNSSVIEHGYVSGEEKKQIYLDCDVLVLPSYGEGLPLVILEAYQTGCAVIASDVGAVPEIVGKENGYVVHPGDREELSNAMRYLIENRNELKAIKECNIIKSQKYTLKQFVTNIANVCEELQGM